MPDMYFGEDGDIKLAAGGDIAVTETRRREDAQNAYIRIMTAPGDFLLYPSIGTELEKLYGMPQSQATGSYGIQLIKEALNRESAFMGRGIDVTATPTGPQTIRFDVKIRVGEQSQELLSIEKDLGITY